MCRPHRLYWLYCFFSSFRNKREVFLNHFRSYGHSKIFKRPLLSCLFFSMLNLVAINHSALSQERLKSSIPFFTPALPTGYETTPRLCNFIQNANLTATIWQCIFPQHTKPSPTAEGIANEIVWISAIDQQGKWGNPTVFDPLANSSFSNNPLIGEILAINNNHEWVVRKPAHPTGAAVDSSTLYIVQPIVSDTQQYQVQKIPVSFFNPQQVLAFPLDGWLIWDQLSKSDPREQPKGFDTQIVVLDKKGERDWILSTVNNPSGYMAFRGLTISAGGTTFIWAAGRSENGQETTDFHCVVDEAKAARGTINYPVDRFRLALALPQNEILLLGTEEENGHSFLIGWVIDVIKGCQSRLWGKIQLPEHWDGLETYSWLEHAVVTPQGEVIAFYAQQWDIRNIRFFVAPPPESTRPDLWAIKFNPSEPKDIIWDKLVISSIDPASESFSANPHQDQRFSMAFFPKMMQIWIHPMVYKSQETPEYYPAEPRIYRLEIE